MGRSSTKPSIVWLVWLLLVGLFELEVILSSSVSRANAMSSSTSTSTATSRRRVVVTMKVQPPSTTMATVDEEAVVEKDDIKVVGKSLDELNYMMSKRRVPNGPDPIHNRRAGNSKRPPGRA